MSGWMECMDWCEEERIRTIKRQEFIIHYLTDYLGRLFYAENKDKNIEEIGETYFKIISSIKTAEERLKKCYLIKIEQEKQIRICKRCGALIPWKSSICNSCGEEVPFLSRCTDEELKEFFREIEELMKMQDDYQYSEDFYDEDTEEENL